MSGQQRAKRRIAIIGGGYTGLAAAFDLSPAHQVTLYERARALGGLAGDFAIQGGALERAYHHLFRTDTDIIALTRELGIERALLWRPSSVGVYRDGAFFPFTGALDILRYKPLTPLARWRLGAVMWWLSRTRDWQALIATPAREWLERHVGHEVVSVLWEPLLRGKFHGFQQDVSMAWLWARIHTRANSRPSVLHTERLGYYEGGFAVLTQALADAILRRGAVIKTETGVQALRPGPDGRIDVVTHEGAQTFDQVLVTAPSPVFARMLPEEDPRTAAYRDALLRIRYLGAVICIFATPQVLTDFYWTNVTDAGSPFLVLVNHTRLMPAAHYGGQQVYYLGQYLPEGHPHLEGDPEEVKAQWFTHLARMVPAFQRARNLEEHLFRFRYAQHLVTTDYPALIPEVRTPWPNLYLANFCQIFPEDRGTNFAIRDGRRAARLLEEEAAHRLGSSPGSRLS